MNFLARMWLGLALVLALASYGGAGDFVRPLLAVAVAITLALIALGQRPQMHAPPLSWIALLFLPLIAVSVLQVLPLGWHHPWVNDDLVLLGTSASAWSIKKIRLGIVEVLALAGAPPLGARPMTPAIALTP